MFHLHFRHYELDPMEELVEHTEEVDQEAVDIEMLAQSEELWESAEGSRWWESNPVFEEISGKEEETNGDKSGDFAQKKEASSK